MASQTQRPDGRAFLAAVTTVAAVYVYFLIFAQFGFLQAVNAVWAGAGSVVDSILAAMGVAGIAGSAVAARRFEPARGPGQLAAGLMLCGLAAVASPWAKSIAAFSTVALLTGLGLGLATVSLASLLQPAVGHRRLGLAIGWGTGAAYAFCNLPGVFDTNATTQALIAGAAALVGLVSSRGLTPSANAVPASAGEYSPRSVAWWVVVFLTLVFLDSAMFYLIQHTADLKQHLWDGSVRQLGNAATHLVAAVLAGWALDRRGAGPTVAAAAIALVAAGWMLGEGRMGNTAAMVYIAAVSVYSTALVYYPSRGEQPRVAAWIYAVAGWIGSALGIGLAEDRGQLPPRVVAIAAILLGISLMGRYFASRPPRAMNENNPV